MSQNWSAIDHTLGLATLIESGNPDVFDDCVIRLRHIPSNKCIAFDGDQGVTSIDAVRANQTYDPRTLWKINSVDAATGAYTLSPLRNPSIALQSKEKGKDSDITVAPNMAASRWYIMPEKWTDASSGELLFAIQMFMVFGKSKRKYMYLNRNKNMFFGTEGPQDGGTLDKFMVDVDTLGVNAWKFLIDRSESMKNRCCISTSMGGPSPTNFVDACKTFMGAEASLRCQDAMRNECSRVGYNTDMCKAWCVKNPEECLPGMEKWCATQPGRAECACWNDVGYNEYKETTLKCSKPPCPLSGKPIQCVFPPCVTSSFRNVKEVTGKCPADIINYQECIIQNNIGSVNAQSVSNACIQQVSTQTLPPESPPGSTVSVTPPPKMMPSWGVLMVGLVTILVLVTICVFFFFYK